MRNVFLAVLIVLFAAVVTKTSGTSGGTTSASIPNGGVYCTMLADSVHGDSARTRIVAAGRFRCDRPGPTSLSMTVTLQKRGANGQWANVAGQTFTAAGAATTRDSSEAERTREVGTGCASGVFRTVVNGASTSQGKRRTYTMTTAGTTDPCTRLRSGR